MASLSRRRFLTITAAACAIGPVAAATMTSWRGVALGAGATITLAHPQAQAILARARDEISRLEDIFSLYRANSALMRLNASGRLGGPPFELLECLSLSDAVHRVSGGRFDPSVQPLWALYAERHAAGQAPSPAAVAATLSRVGWSGVRSTPAEISFARPAMALTLNGIAQGYIADRVADLLRAEGLTDVLVDTGELRALGGQPEGGDWPVQIGTSSAMLAHTLREAALATSAPLGTVFDEAGRVGHILDPRTGRPAAARWQSVTITAPRAGLADALTTAACLMTRDEIDAMIAAFPGVALVHLG